MGNWKDYAINFNKNEANFYMYKHSLASPDCILTKSIKYKKQKFIYKLKYAKLKKNKFGKIDDLIVFLKRKQFVILKF